MKRFVFGILIALVLITSCSTLKDDPIMPGGQSTVPTRYIEVTNMNDLENQNYVIIGEVSGMGKVNADNPEMGDTHCYGKLLTEETKDFERTTMAGIDPYEVSLGNAIYQLIENTHKVGGNFVIFPSSTVQFTDDREIITNVFAIAVKVLPTAN